MREQIVQDWNKKELELADKGKKPFYLKKAELKKMELTKVFEEMRSDPNRNMEKFLEKRRKKIAQKQRAFLPRERQRN